MPLTASGGGALVAVTVISSNRLSSSCANAAVPILTVIGLTFATLIGGVVVTESVFTLPGLGLLTVDAVLARDYPTIQTVILLFSLAYVVVNLLVGCLVVAALTAIFR